MKIIKILLVLTTLLFIKTDSAKDYYFQLQDLKEGIVFKYECKSDPSETQYWKLTSNKNTLITEAYNNDLEKFEFFLETYTETGTKVTKFVSYNKNKDDEMVVIDSRLITTDVFNWSTDTDCNYSTEFIDKDYGQVSFSMHRYFIKKTEISVLGTNYKVLKYKCIYRTKIPSDNYDYAYTQYMYYAKGLGLVKIEKEYPNGKSAVLKLTEIITKEDWDKIQ
jgi:hypothetical protein